MTNGDFQTPGAGQSDVPLDVPLRRFRPRLDHRGHHHDGGHTDHGVEHPPGQCRRGDALMATMTRLPRRPSGKLPQSKPRPLRRPCCGAGLRGDLDLPDRRPADLLAARQGPAALSGWWTSLAHSTLTKPAASAPPTPQTQEGAQLRCRRATSSASPNGQTVETFGVTNADIGKTPAGTAAAMRRRRAHYGAAERRLSAGLADQVQLFRRAAHLLRRRRPPRFTIDNYRAVLNSDGHRRNPSSTR